MHHVVQAHRLTWRADRDRAINLRYASYQADSPDLFEVDDKCGRCVVCFCRRAS